VVSPLVRAQAELTPTTTVSAGYVADVVTSASIDIVTQASKITIHDVRHQPSASLGQVLGDWTVRAGYLYSTENDYTSHNVTGGLERRMAENATTLAVGFAASLDTVGRAKDGIRDPNFQRSLSVFEGSLAFTQVLSPKLVGQLSLAVGDADGYQASPYRRVPLAGVTDPMLWVEETDPSSRIRWAAVAGVNYHVFSDSAVQADYRFYQDSWSITSHTVQLRYIVNLTESLELRLRNRFYLQSGASFYQSSYTEVMRYMTIDRELSQLWSELFGVKLSWKVASVVEAELKADGFYYSYPDFPRLPSRVGANLGAGVALTF
jgi:hypothetical protein